MKAARASARGCGGLGVIVGGDDRDILEAAALASGLPDGVGLPVVRSALWRTGFEGQHASEADLFRALPELRTLLLEHLGPVEVERAMERLSALARKAPSLPVPRRAPSEPPSLMELTAKLRENNVRMSMSVPANDTPAAESVLKSTWLPPKITGS